MLPEIRSIDINIPALFSKRSEPLVFIRDCRVPFRNKSSVDAEMEKLRNDPVTAKTMQTIIEGPNAFLYDSLISKLQGSNFFKTESFTKERKAYLFQAIGSLFFGLTITDANIEGMILYGGADKWNSRLTGDIFDMEAIHPEHYLLKQRVAEIVNHGFHLPQNETDMKANADKQIARIKKQLTDGTLQRKAKQMGKSARKGKKVGEEMICALGIVRDCLI